MGDSQTSLLLYFAVLAVAFYLLIIRPQQQRQKQQRELLSKLKVGDRVVTVSGIFGMLSAIEADVVVLKVAEGVEIEMAKGAVSQVVDSFASEMATKDHAQD